MQILSSPISVEAAGLVTHIEAARLQTSEVLAPLGAQGVALQVQHERRELLEVAQALAEVLAPLGAQGVVSQPQLERTTF